MAWNEDDQHNKQCTIEAHLILFASNYITKLELKEKWPDGADCTAHCTAYIEHEIWRNKEWKKKTKNIRNINRW